MTKRYEIVRSSDNPSLVLIFPEGTWESLPFEIRLLRPWYESEFCDRNSLCDRGSLTPTQHLDIATQGYCIADCGLQHEKSRPGPTESEGGSHSTSDAYPLRAHAELKPDLIAQYRDGGRRLLRHFEHDAEFIAQQRSGRMLLHVLQRHDDAGD